MQNSESGRKINQAVNNTSRAVGGAISQAKGAFSYWWSSITTAPTTAASTNSNDSSNGESPNRPQEISVTFQNNSNEDKIEVGISVHTEEGVIYKKINKDDETSRSGTPRKVNSPPDEKLVDSAEELMEENQLDNFNSTQEIENQKTNLPIEATARRGIVEIAKEAEILDKEDNKAEVLTTNNCGTVEATDSATCTNGNGGIFIV